MAKKAAKPKPADAGELKTNAADGELFETQNVSRKIKKLANRYRDEMTTKSSALVGFNSARDNLIDAMEEDDVERVLIDVGGVRKWIICSHAGAVKLVTVKEEDGGSD
jgi:hypothetical protein